MSEFLQPLQPLELGIGPFKVLAADDLDLDWFHTNLDKLIKQAIVAHVWGFRVVHEEDKLWGQPELTALIVGDWLELKMKGLLV